MKEKLIKRNILKENMKKTIMFSLILLLASSGHALFGLFERPISEANIEYVDTIPSAGYGFIGANVTCSAFNFEVPNRQTSQNTYLKIGYFPICGVNASSYVQDVTVFCAGEYVLTSNYTDNCVQGGFYEFEWVKLFHGNLTEIASGTNIITCQLCVNNTTTTSQTDFFVKIENLGNRIEVTNQTIEVFPQLANVVAALDHLVLLVDAVIVLFLGLISGLTPIWVVFAMILAFVFLFIQLRKKARELSKRRN